MRPSDESKPTNSVERVAFGDYAVHTEIEINAPADLVWATLTDFDNLQWSSSFKGLDAKVEPGAQVTAHFNLMGLRQSFDHTLIEVEPGVQWAWSDPFLLGMIDHHVYRVEPVDDEHSRFIQTDRANAGVAIVAGRLTAAVMKRMYVQFNEELKVETERRRRQR